MPFHFSIWKPVHVNGTGSGGMNSCLSCLAMLVMIVLTFFIVKIHANFNGILDFATLLYVITVYCCFPYL